MVAGIALGYFAPDLGARMEPLGTAFIKAIRVLIAPIIFCTVVHGISGMASMAKVGRVALKALIYFEVLTTIALVIGLVAVNSVPTWRRHARRSFACRHLGRRAVPATDTAAERGAISAQHHPQYLRRRV